MKINWKSKIAVFAVLLTVGMLEGCNKEPQKDTDDKFVPIFCTVDLHGSDRDGLSLLTMGSGFSLTSNNAQMYVQECETPQLFIVADEDDHVRMMYRGVVAEGQSIEVNAHTTSLALVTCNPIVAMIGDSNYATLLACIEALPSYTQFETEVQSVIESGKDILDTTNVRLLQSLQRLIEELVGPIPMDTKAKSAPSWVDCDPLEFQWAKPNEPWGSFTLRNFSICPTYYGTITSGSQTRELVVPSKGSYSISGIMTNIFLREDFLHGNAVKVDLSPNEDNTVELTNLHDSRAVTEIGTNFVKDIVEIVKLPFPDYLLKEVSTEAGKMIADAAIEAAHNEGNTLSAVSKSIAHSVKEYVIGKGYQFLINSPALFAPFDGDIMWGVKMLNITKKIFDICSFGESAINIGTRIYFLLYYPNDISFCIHYTDDSGQKSVRPCGESEEDWVDLGLPSGLLWATRNVGASSPEDYGAYFAWGETSSKSVYDWATYRWCYNGMSYQLTKYCTDYYYGYNSFTDGLTTLQPDDDAATVNYGGRTPTIDEWGELISNTTGQCVTQNGVNGVLLMGSNGSSLFLPAAGYRLDSSLVREGIYGHYWSSSIYGFYPVCACCFDFNSNGPNLYNHADRNYGRTIRAVRQK